MNILEIDFETYRLPLTTEAILRRKSLNIPSKDEAGEEMKGECLRIGHSRL